MKALHITQRDQSYTLALDLGAKVGMEGVKSLLCKGHLEAWDQNVINGATMLVKMIQKEAEELAREAETEEIFR